MLRCRVYCVFALLVMLIAAAPVRAAKGSCASVDVPVTITFATLVPGISSDGLGPYVDGQAGVSAKIQVCNNYYDLLLGFSSNSTRHFLYTFGVSSNLAVTAATPAWTQSSTSLLINAAFNVNQIADPTLCPGPACYNKDAESTFTTYMWNYNIAGPDGKTYSLDYVSDDPVSDTGQQNVGIGASAVNKPYSTSLVQVHHIPASTAPSGHETWIVQPIANCGAAGSCCLLANCGATGSLCPLSACGLSSQYSSSGCCADQYPGAVATLELQRMVKGWATYTNVGQFSMPFYMTITRN